MQGIASFAMKGRYQALVSVLLFSVISVWIAPFGILVGAIIALITLRVGVVEGIQALAWGVISHLFLTVMLSGSYWPGFISVMEYMLPVWVLSLVLRQTNSLASTLQVAMIMSGIGVLGFYLLISNPQDWWLELFSQHVLPILDASKVVYEAESVKIFAGMVTMLLAVFAVVLWYSIVLIARYWQSSLYHPGQFKIDFYQLRLPKSTAYAAIVLALLAVVFEFRIVIDLSTIVMVGLMFQGLAIAHQTLAVKKCTPHG
ncbi:hypothetical protein [Thiomicrorhabdus aquaedulcis]|uniref:hypothetical protein n=1 Tax=Thiomicrorhabdus aquaedulcis TaxID=2211106 RepID=UPI000FDA90F4|nr:hypothetical protein [Thiomicrorhabdus aquaedulcis]